MLFKEDEQHNQESCGQERTQRACDACRKKKARCNAPEGPGGQCANCVKGNINCTYIEPAPRRSLSKRYIARLEDRIMDLEELLRKLCPDDEIHHEWIGELTQGDAAAKAAPISPSALSGPLPDAFLSLSGAEALEFWAHIIRLGNDDDLFSQSDDENPGSRVVASSLDSCRFFGKSSSEAFIRQAIFTKKTWAEGEAGLERPVLRNRREEFWALRPWERALEATQHQSHYTFPEPRLAKELLECYFEHINLHFPLLHRPSFERSVRDNLHYTNGSFGAVYLLVCAIGSRFSNDPKVLFDGSDSYHSAGWKWFNQVETGRMSYLSLPSLHDLQLHCLTMLFLQSSSAPQSVWTMVGIALRLAQDVGVHRLRSRIPSAEDELWKRAFWVLICIDRIVSASVGRSCAIQDEDFDLDLPIDCDDEYWEHPDPDKRFKQPPGKPSTMSGFILLQKLSYILNCCIRGLYAPPKGDVWFHPLTVQEWKPRVLRELDSSLNKWLDSVPEHLRWDPNRENIQHFNISALLHALYYHIQILTHRPFIPSTSKPSLSPFPSLIICTNGARACMRIVDAQRLRNGSGSPPLIQMAAFTSAVVLLFSIWGQKDVGGGSQQGTDDLELLRTCLQMLKTSEVRWHLAGNLLDMLAELSSMDDCTRHLCDPRANVPNLLADNSNSETSDGQDQWGREIDTSVYPPIVDPTTLRRGPSIGHHDGTTLSPRLALETAQSLPPTFLLQSLGLLHSSSMGIYDSSLLDRPGAAQFELQDQPEIAHSWSNVPTGFNLDDWNMYLATGRLTRAE